MDCNTERFTELTCLYALSVFVLFVLFNIEEAQVT
jgi:hypothetical protein